MSKSPAVVDANGDISVHRQAGASILVTVAGVTAPALSFRIEGQAALPLTSTGTTDQYQLSIPKTAVDVLPQTGAQFALVVTGGAVDLVYWEGRITARGFA